MIYGQKTRRRGGAIARVGLWLAALGGVIVGAVGCGGGGGSDNDRSPTASNQLQVTSRVVSQNGWNVSTPAYQQPRKKWTFLVYMNGANDLETYGVLNMNQMEQIGSNSNINIAVQFKRIHQNGSDDSSNGDWNDTRRFFVTRDADTNTIGSQLISRRSDVDMGDWQELQNFIQWGRETFPAERYCLVVWNHGAGWRTAKPKSGTVTRGVSYDDATGNSINTVDIPRGIDIGDGNKWDILAFDSSLMQMVEVAYEVRDHATYIVGSEESPPGEGYPYHRFLGNLTRRMANGETPTPREFADDIVQQTIEDYGPDSVITHSVLDASKVAAIVPAVDTLGRLLYENRDRYRNEIRAARENTERYAAKDYYSLYEYRDLRHFTEMLLDPSDDDVAPITDGTIVSAARAVQQTLDDAIVKNVNGSLHPNSNGLSIYLTDPYTYGQIDVLQANGFGQRYVTLSFAKAAPNWNNFLKNGPN